MNGKQEEKLQRLLKLKRHESPGQPYFDHFLAEFHRYQRADLLETPSKWKQWQEWKEYFRDLFVARPLRTLAYGSSFAAVAVLALAGLSSSMVPAGEGLSLASDLSVRALASSSNRYAEATEEALRQIEVQPVALSAFDRDFNAPRFVTGERTLAYENTVAF